MLYLTLGVTVFQVTLIYSFIAVKSVKLDVLLKHYVNVFMIESHFSKFFDGGKCNKIGRVEFRIISQLLRLSIPLMKM